ALGCTCLTRHRWRRGVKAFNFRGRVKSIADDISGNNRASDRCSRRVCVRGRSATPVSRLLRRRRRFAIVCRLHKPNLRHWMATVEKITDAGAGGAAHVF
ncbi:unnamed protein product, partial [Ectocarpus sp. 6 AP-2014]